MLPASNVALGFYSLIHLPGIRSWKNEFFYIKQLAESGLNVKAGSFVLFRRHIYIILKAKASKQAGRREREYIGK